MSTMTDTQYRQILESGAEKFQHRVSCRECFTCQLHDSPEQCADFDADDFRIDSQTGECMDEGWLISHDFYIADEQRAEQLTQALWGQTVAEAYAEDDATCYWTQWS